MYPWYLFYTRTFVRYFYFATHQDFFTGQSTAFLRTAPGHLASKSRADKLTGPPSTVLFASRGPAQLSQRFFSRTEVR
jgi:hypothetical protein